MYASKKKETELASGLSSRVGRNLWRAHAIKSPRGQRPRVVDRVRISVAGDRRQRLPVRRIQIVVVLHDVGDTGAGGKRRCEARSVVARINDLQLLAGLAGLEIREGGCYCAAISVGHHTHPD
jgi:hypothetical protein